MNFVAFGYEIDRVPFLLNSVPSISVSDLTKKLKSITAKQLFQRHPEIKAN